MYIGCTKKLQEYLKITPSAPSAAPLFSWSANLLTVNHRKVIAVFNDAARYGFILYGVTAKTLKNLDSLILAGVRSCLEEECIVPALIERYINDTAVPIYGNTVNRTAVARMNKFCQRIYFYADEMNPGDIEQKHLLGRINENIYEIDKVYYTSSNLLEHELGEYYKTKSIRECRAGVFDITLELDSVCTRRVIVPMGYSFAKFHHVLQRLFNWQDYHLHLFVTEFHPDGRMKSVIAPPECEDDFIDKNLTVEYDVKLNDIFPAKREIVYCYDLGDDWTHRIRLVEIMDGYEYMYPMCLSGEGDAPPEDVGGAYGYAEFKRILSDESDPEYEVMKAWASDVRHDAFDIKAINIGLKYR